MWRGVILSMVPSRDLLIFPPFLSSPFSATTSIFATSPFSSVLHYHRQLCHHQHDLPFIVSVAAAFRSIALSLSAAFAAALSGYFRGRPPGDFCFGTGFD